ncbi:MAG: MBOAT family protein [Fluviicola sp.]|nr:MBOAT family protein [Fluviicola sp.]
MERLHEIFSFLPMSSMTFNRLDFWLFFIFIMMVFSLLHKNQLMRSIFITIVSLFLYFKTSGLFVLLLGLSIVVNFGLGKLIYTRASDVSRKWVIAFSAIFNVFFLGYFKYAYFFTDSYNKMFGTDYQILNKFAVWGNGFFGDGTFETTILLPAGVSFFTFQSISYVVDIYRKEIKPVKNFWDYAFYVTYFPHVIMGPIVRARDFIPQIYQPFQLNKKVFSESVFLIVKGLFKKIILADFIAVHFIDKVVDAPDAYPGFVAVLAMWGYSLQIYGDFSGYTDVAIGISRLMGFELLPNFNSPYKANSVADFWRRWHKSLGAWLRDYLYIPLGGNKKGTIGTYVAIFIIFIFLVFITGWYELIFVYIGLMALYGIAVLISPKVKTFMHRDLNLLITMIIGGLWHGPSENFVIWGAMNGAALVFYNYWKKISPYEKSSWLIVHFWKVLLTFNFITFTRIWFRLKEDGAPNHMLDRIFNHFDFKWETLGTVLWSFGEVFIVIGIGFILHWLPQRWKDSGVAVFGRLPLFVQMLGIALAVILMYQAVSESFKPFVYLEF